MIDVSFFLFSIFFFWGLSSLWDQDEFGFKRVSALAATLNEATLKAWHVSAVPGGRGKGVWNSTF